MTPRYLPILLVLLAGCGVEPVEGGCPVLETYPPAAGQDGSTAIYKDDPAIQGWATGYVSPVSYGADLDDRWRTPERALGPAKGDSADVVSLGNGGSITL